MLDQAVRVRGVRAVLKWRNYPAARIEGYSVAWEKTPDRWSVVGQVVERDPFKLALRPLVFAALTRKPDGSPGQEMYWPVREFTLLENGRLAATLGQPLTEDPRTWPAVV